jgi:hypothetical protein
MSKCIVLALLFMLNKKENGARTKRKRKKEREPVFNHLHKNNL